MGETIARNKKAYHDYEILDSYEAGMVLKGSEVKAIRLGRVNLKDSFVKIIKGEAFLLNAHISNLDTTHSHYRPDERRERKLLLHLKEIEKLEEKSSKDGLSIVPTSMYFNHKNFIKIKIALARGKQLHDKREDLKRRTANREAQTAMKNHFYK
ncbi:SsrA-binding protein SmpB [Sulfurospirillum arcachonense]|uniref:SsrA-binding protein SmpB n=1 Tax=Sulfurospirillum arcachonense TaxID=57666 RepID=UPI000469D458|nr:SsrA-binding protein SmpB [Sulfurospirillum arcachonense]